MKQTLYILILIPILTFADVVRFDVPGGMARSLGGEKELRKQHCLGVTIIRKEEHEKWAPLAGVSIVGEQYSAILALTKRFKEVEDYQLIYQVKDNNPPFSILSSYVFNEIVKINEKSVFSLSFANNTLSIKTTNDTYSEKMKFIPRSIEYVVSSSTAEIKLDEECL